jgi:hypothetical protein
MGSYWRSRGNWPSRPRVRDAASKLGPTDSPIEPRYDPDGGSLAYAV